MNCEEATQLISARLDGELSSDADAAALDEHLAGCPGCRAVADALATQDASLDAAFAERREAATAVAERVVTRWAHEVRQAPPAGAPLRRSQRSWWTSWGKPLLAAAAGFALAVVLMRPAKTADHPTQVADRGTSNPASTVTTSAVRPVAQLALSTGAVFVCPAGSDDWRPLASGGAVEAGAKVRTGPRVRCEFKLADGSEVRLNADTEVTLPASRRVEVASGQVFSSVRKQADESPFVVRAMAAQTTLTALGTAFDVSCAPADKDSASRATLTVVEGAVRVDSGGAENVIRGGERLTVADGRPGAKETVKNLMRATQWVDEILVMKGRDDPELARRVDDIFAQLGHEKMWYLDAQEVRRLGDHCIIPLSRYIETDRSKQTDDDRMKRREAARIVGDVATTWAIPELINLLGDTDGDVRYPAALALQRLTSQSLGRRPEEWRDQPLATCAPTVDKWRDWWEKNKDRFPGVDPNAVRPAPVVKQRPSEKQKA